MNQQTRGLVIVVGILGVIAFVLAFVGAPTIVWGIPAFAGGMLLGCKK